MQSLMRLSLTRYGMANRAPSASSIVPTVPLTACALRRALTALVTSGGALDDVLAKRARPVW